MALFAGGILGAVSARYEHGVIFCADWGGVFAGYGLSAFFRL
jgi:hypothetical protein